MSGMKLAAAAALAASLMAGGAWAQMSATNPKAPIDVTADGAEVLKDECKSTWKGDAEALQNDARLRAHTITGFFFKKADGCGDMTRLEADGDVYYVTPQQTVRGDHAVYTAGSGTIVVTGNVVVVQGKNVARGDRLTYQVSSGAMQLDGPKGRGAGGRVRAVIFPDSAQKP